MTVSLKHQFTSAKSDGGDNTLVQPSNWNAEHTLTLANDRVLGRNAGTDGAAQELTGSDLRTLTGLATTDSPQFTAINLGHASDTTLARSGAGDVTIEGNAIYRAGGTDVAVADGGTGASTAAAGFRALAEGVGTTQGDLLYRGASQWTVLGAGTSGQVLQSGGAGGNPSWVSPSTATTAECRLTYVSSSSIRLDRHNGRWLFIAGKVEEIPSTEPTLANTGLTAATLYYIYAYMNSGTMTLEASTTTYAEDATYGQKIKSGDGTRTLVGMVYMGAGTPGTFVDSSTQRYVISYHNRILAPLASAISGAQTSTASPWSEITTGGRTEFLHWGDEAVDVTTYCAMYHGTANVAMYFRVAFGVAVGTYATGGAATFYGVSAGANYIANASSAGTYTPALGLNTATAQGGRDSGTANYLSAYHGYNIMVKK